jgi:hypothetical protein
LIGKQGPGNSNCTTTVCWSFSAVIGNLHILFPRGSKNGVGDSRRNWGYGGLAKASRHFRALQKMSPLWCAKFQQNEDRLEKLRPTGAGVDFSGKSSKAKEVHPPAGYFKLIS